MGTEVTSEHTTYTRKEGGHLKRNRPILEQSTVGVSNSFWGKCRDRLGQQGADGDVVM